MPGSAETQLTVRTGAAEPRAVDLRPGQTVGPLSIGRLGTWRVVAPGVLEEHGFVYFNGTELFLQSTNPNSPLLADGSPIGREWTPVYAPCEIAMGGARLFFGSPHGTTDAMAAVAPRAPQSPSAPAGFAPRVRGNDDDEATRVAPVEELAAMRGRVPAAPPAPAPAPFNVPPPTFAAPPMGTPSFGPTPFVEQQAPPAAGVAPPPGAPAPAAKQSRVAAAWRETSGPKKALIVLMAPLIWAVWVIFTDKPPPPSPPRPPSSASARPTAAPSATPAATPPAPATSAPETARAPSASSSAAPAAGSPATAGPKTPQREAADAVAAGAFDRAATLYEDLARAHPDVPAYAAAARIMRAKAGKR
jgi:hypothetical protein